MLVTRVELEALTASFRYPFFMVGRQPSYDVPPPATIYGLICAATGDWIAPDPLRFAYWFSHNGKVDDLEHAHIVGAGGAAFNVAGVAFRGNMQGTIQPTRREFLLHPRLTLYIQGDELAGAFRSPAYPITLGRSQDLAMVCSVSILDLEQASNAYYERTILPFSWRADPRCEGVTLIMPRFVDYTRNRTPTFVQYIALTEGFPPFHPDDSSAIGAGEAAHWVDPDAPRFRSLQRGVAFHSFTN